jgi:hypothetical protein
VDLNLCLSLCLCLSLSLSVKRERERVWCEPGHVGVSMLLGLVDGVGYNSQMKVGKGVEKGSKCSLLQKPPLPFMFTRWIVCQNPVEKQRGNTTPRETKNK